MSNVLALVAIVLASLTFWAWLITSVFKAAGI